MKTINIIAVLLLVAHLASGQVKASFDYDKTIDFSTYTTFGFTEDAMNYDMQQFNRDRLITAIRNELIAKGLEESDDPDMLVNFYIHSGEKERATANTNYYGAGGRYGYRLGGGFSTTSINVETYIAGTVFIDLIDAGSNNLVWQGRGEGSYQEDISPEKREKRINKGITKIFKKYPPNSK